MNSLADLYSKKRKGYRKKKINDFVYFIILSTEILVMEAIIYVQNTFLIIQV